MSTLQAILALLGTLAGIVAVVLNRRYDTSTRRESDILQAQREVASALARRRYDDASFWATRLRTLRATPPQVAPDRPDPSAPLAPIILLCALCALSGCISPSPQRPVLILGQRVLSPSPNTTLIIPPLTPPAQQWYLVDDIGLSLWLGISLPAPVPSVPPPPPVPSVPPVP
jgi:hypothetical protein